MQRKRLHRERALYINQVRRMSARVSWPTGLTLSIGRIRYSDLTSPRCPTSRSNRESRTAGVLSLCLASDAWEACMDLSSPGYYRAVQHGLLSALRTRHPKDRNALAL